MTTQIERDIAVIQDLAKIGKATADAVTGLSAQESGAVVNATMLLLGSLYVRRGFSTPLSDTPVPPTPFIRRRL